MPVMTNASVAALQLEAVKKDLPVLFERDSEFFTWVAKGTDVEKVSERDMRVPQELRPGGKARGYNPEGGDLGRGSASTYDKALVNTSKMLFAVEWTLLSDDATNSDVKAIKKATADQLAKSMIEFRRHIDSWMMTDGTGTLATVTTVGTGTGTNGGDRLTFTTDGYRARLLRFDAPVGIYDTTLATKRNVTDLTINFYDGPNNTVDVFPSLGGAIVAGDKVVVGGLSATPPVWLLGVPYHNSNASTGTWLGYSRATTPEIRSNRVAAGGPLALPHARLVMSKLIDRVGIDADTSPVAWMHMAQQAAYEELGMLVSVINKGNKEEGIDLYFNTDDMRLAGAPCKLSPSWDRTRIDFITKAFMGRAEQVPVGFLQNASGGNIFQMYGATGGPAAARGFYYRYHAQLYTKKPSGLAYIDTLSIPSGY